MKEKFEFRSTDKVTTLKGFKWIPENRDIKAIVTITHGMVEYIDRYDGFASYLAENGYLVAGYDQLGHGDSVVSTDDWGYFGENPLDLLLGDMDHCRRLLEEEYPGKPVFMLGHSMGSYELRCYLAEHGEGLAGAAIVGTGFISEKMTRRGRKFLHAMALMRGWHFRSALAEKMAFGEAYEHFDLTGEDPENSWLTKDTDIVEAYHKEPRCTFKFTLNGYLGLMDAVEMSCNPENVQKVPAELPVFIASGEDDPVGDLGDGVLLVYRMFRDRGIKDLACHIYDGDRHEILNELDRDRIWNDFRLWFDRHCE